MQTYATIYSETIKKNRQELDKYKASPRYERIYQTMIKILFVCHGNICRSPMAEFVMKAASIVRVILLERSVEKISVINVPCWWIIRIAPEVLQIPGTQEILMQPGEMWKKGAVACWRICGKIWKNNSIISNAAWLELCPDQAAFMRLKFDQLTFCIV